MTLWRRKREQAADHHQAEQAVEREKQAQAEIRAKEAELNAKRPVIDALGRSLSKHWQDNHFGDIIRIALEGRGERH